MTEFLCSVFLLLCASQAQVDGVDRISNQAENDTQGELVSIDKPENIHKVTNFAVKENSWVYRDLVNRHVVKQFGNDDFLSSIAGQARQEASWRCDLSSKYADGCMQFTPQTAKWAAATFCRDLGQPRPERPNWAYPCGVRYMSWLYDRVTQFNTTCDRLSFAMMDYNGGAGNRKKQQRRTAEIGMDAGDVNQVRSVRVRAEWAHKENTHYPVAILGKWAPEYIKVNYGGKDICAHYQFL